jgi:hypothetical protein
LWCCHECHPRLNFDECGARVVFSGVGDMSENTTKTVHPTLANSGIRETIQRTKFIINFSDNHLVKITDNS